MRSIMCEKLETIILKQDKNNQLRGMNFNNFKKNEFLIIQ